MPLRNVRDGWACGRRKRNQQGKARDTRGCSRVCLERGRISKQLYNKYPRASKTRQDTRKAATFSCAGGERLYCSKCRRSPAFSNPCTRTTRDRSRSFVPELLDFRFFPRCVGLHGVHRLLDTDPLRACGTNLASGSLESRLIRANAQAPPKV